MRNNIALILLLTAILASCGVNGSGLQSTSAKFENQRELVQPMYSSPTYRFAFPLTLPEGMSNQTWETIFDNYTHSPKTLHHGEMMNKIRQAKTWQEADVLGRKLIQDLEKEEVSFFAQQQIASGMLRSFFIHEEVTPETQRMMAFYMDMLIRNKYFSEPSLFAQILPKLQGYWENQKISEIAKKSVPYGAKIYALWKGQPFTLENYFLAQAQSLKASNSTENSNTLQATALELRNKFQQNIPLEASKLKTKYEREDWSSSTHLSFEDTVILALLAEGNSNNSQK
jgi:hypothetical protein